MKAPVAKAAEAAASDYVPQSGRSMELRVYNVLEVTLSLGLGGLAKSHKSTDPNVYPQSRLLLSSAPHTLVLFSTTHDARRDNSRRIPTHLTAGLTARSRRIRLDEHGHRRHHDGRASSQ